MSEDANIPKPERIGANPFFVILYLLVFAGIVLYPGYVNGFSLRNFSWENYSDLKGHLIPAFFFALAGIMTVRVKKSIIFAFCAAAISLFILAAISG